MVMPLSENLEWTQRIPVSLAFFMISSQALDRPHGCTEFTWFGCSVSRELLDGKLGSGLIVEQLKWHAMVLESWELVQANQNVPHFARGTLSSAFK